MAWQRLATLVAGKSLPLELEFQGDYYKPAGVYKIKSVSQAGSNDTVYFQYEDPYDNFGTKFYPRANIEQVGIGVHSAIYKSWTQDAMWKVPEPKPALNSTQKAAVIKAIEALQQLL